MEKTPSWAEMESAKKAAEKALKEKTEWRVKEKAEHKEAERLRRLWQKAEAEKAGPHVITEKDIAEAEKKVGKKFEKLH